MSSTRLLHHHRLRILTAALQHAFDAKEKTLAKEGDALFRAIRIAWLGTAGCRKIDRLPDGWARTSLKFTIKIRERWHEVAAIRPQRVPARLECCGDQLPADLRARIALHSQALAELKESRRQAGDKMRSALRGFSTLESLTAKWPEIEPFTKGIQPAVATLPAIQIADANRALGLTA